MSQMRAQVDKLLTPVSSGYFPKGMICENILPVVQSAQFTGLLGKYGTSHLRIENTVKGGRGKYRRVEAMTRTTAAFVIEGHGLEGVVTKEDYRNVEKPFDAEKDEVIGLSSLLFIEKEKLLADTLTSTSIVTQNTTLSGTSQFSDYVNSDPVSVIKTALNAILDGCGTNQDVVMALDKKVYNTLKYHPALLDMLGFKFHRPGGLTAEEIAKAFEIDRVEIADARYESAAEGQTSALLPVWGKHIVIGVFPKKSAIMQTSGGYMVRLTGSQPRKVYKKSDGINPPESTQIVVEDEYDMLISNAGAIYLIKDAIA